MKLYRITFERRELYEVYIEADSASLAELAFRDGEADGSEEWIEAGDLVESSIEVEDTEDPL